MWQKPTGASRPEFAAQLGKTGISSAAKPSVVSTSTTTPSNTTRQPPPPPTRAPVPPPPPAEPDVELYKAKFGFQGQEGEMTLDKDDVVELVEKTDNGWWLVKKKGVEGWAPNNYLVLVPPQPKAMPTPPPPPPPPTQRKVPAHPQATTTVTPTVKPSVKSLVAESNAKPVSVFPGMGPSNGSTTPWKKTHISQESTDNSPNSSRPNSSLGIKPPLPVATKPKPGPPPIALKPNVPGNNGPPRIPGKPPIPSTQRPTGTSRPVPPKLGGKNPTAVGGQLDLAAAVSTLGTFFTVQGLI